MSIPGFSSARATLRGIDIAYEIGGSGPPVLLLHGFPQTRAMWAQIAPVLARSHRVICPDLRGYGDSAKPEGVPAYSFREMARDQVALLHHLGFESAAIIGHDRGARVAHRLALDTAEMARQVAFLDIIPTHSLLSDLRRDVAAAYYHWFFLAQPAPFPETLIGHDPDAYFHSCLLGWGGSGLADFAPEQLAAYRRAWRDPATIHAMCNDYRAALSHDFDDDAADLDRQVTCPALILCGRDGVMARCYDMDAIWAGKCRDMNARAVTGGHFFPDTNPEETANILLDFLSNRP